MSNSKIFTRSQTREQNRSNQTSTKSGSTRSHPKVQKKTKKTDLEDREAFFVPLCVKNNSTSSLSQELVLAYPEVPKKTRAKKKACKLFEDESIFQTALNNVNIDTLVLKKNRIEELRGDFSHAIDMPQTVSNQRNSGRCWIFAMQNIFRKFLIQKYALAPSFELSASYLAYYDLLEKSNLFLASVWDLRKEDHMENSVLHLLLKQPVSDGGQWNMLLNLVSKYGVVPKNLMPETVHSGNTQRVNAILNRILRSCALKILGFSGANREQNRDLERSRSRQKMIQNQQLEQFKEMKETAIAKIKEVLQLFYGNPPTGPMTWKFSSSKSLEQIMAPNADFQDQKPPSLVQVTELEAACAVDTVDRTLIPQGDERTEQLWILEGEKNFDSGTSPSVTQPESVFRKTNVFTGRFDSPSDFYRQTVLFANPHLKLSEFVCLMHYPVPYRPQNRWYTVPYLNNIVNGCESVFFNTSIEVMEKAVRNSLNAGEPVWFAADVSTGASWSTGVLDPGSTNISAFFKIEDLCQGLQDKGARMQMCGGAPNHAMIIKGYDVNSEKKDSSGAPVQKYLVENSWGSNFFASSPDVVMSREWFLEHVYNVAVHARHLEFIKDQLNADKKIYHMSPYEPFGGILRS